MKYILILFILIFASGQLLAEEITSREFAAGYYLEVGKNGPVHSILLPEDVYQTVKSSDLRDVRVFNGAGEVVPHEFRTVKTEPAPLSEKEAIPFFPLFQEVTATSNLSGISLQVSRDTAGALVNIQTEPAGDSTDKKITGYLLDLSNLKKSVSELLFYWHKEIESSVFTISIEQSNDLERWTPLVHRATLADLQFSGQQVERRTVELPKQPMQYLKLTWQDSPWPLKLTEVAGFSQAVDDRTGYRWVSLYNGNVQEKDGQVMVDFETDYRLPTSSVQVRFPEVNSIARLSVQSRPDADKQWRTRCEQVFHDLNFAGTAIQNRPCDFSSSADPLWRLIVKEDGAGLRPGKGVLTLQLGWQPGELVFIGRGAPPYLLAFGSSKIARQDKKPHSGMLLQTMQMESPTHVVGLAKIGTKIELGGELALLPPAEPIPWIKWLLWTVLVLGVALLAFMARSLIKEMKAEKEKRVSEDK